MRHGLAGLVNCRGVGEEMGDAGVEGKDWKDP